MRNVNTEGAYPDFSDPLVFLTREDGTCWQWLGSFFEQGYARYNYKLGYGTQYAHAVHWEMFNGRRPEGFELDHLCRNIACVRLNHLELVSNRENTLRSANPTAINARRTLCKNGHQFDGQNDQQRYCKTCRAEATRRYRMKGK